MKTNHSKSGHRETPEAKPKRQHASVIKNANTKGRLSPEEEIKEANRRYEEMWRQSEEQSMENVTALMRSHEDEWLAEEKRERREAPLKCPLSMTQEERDRELETLRVRINNLETEIKENEITARNILNDAVGKAKEIGDLLERVKTLLPHGEYQEWIKDWFVGSPATARAYKRIAENWSEISLRQTKAKRGMSIREALRLLQDESPEMPEYAHGYETLLGKFERMITDWNGDVCNTLAADSELLESIKALCLERIERIREETVPVT